MSDDSTLVLAQREEDSSFSKSSTKASLSNDSEEACISSLLAEECKPEKRPAYRRAKSEPSLRCTKEVSQNPLPKRILRHANTRSNDETRPPRTVHFGMVDIREYPMIPGDNPGCMKGVPLTIDWQHARTKEACRQSLMSTKKLVPGAERSRNSSCQPV